VFKGRESAPETTVTVPGSVLKIASKLIPRRAREALQERGIIKLAENPDARGTLVEVEDEEERADRHRSGVASRPILHANGFTVCGPRVHRQIILPVA